MRIAAAGGLVVGILALAGPAGAGALTEQIVSQLRQQGYNSVTVTRTLLGRDRIVASSPTRDREIIVNPRTEEVLRDFVDDRPAAAATIDSTVTAPATDTVSGAAATAAAETGATEPVAEETAAPSDDEAATDGDTGSAESGSSEDGGGDAASGSTDTGAADGETDDGGSGSETESDTGSDTGGDAEGGTGSDADGGADSDERSGRDD